MLKPITLTVLAVFAFANAAAAASSADLASMDLSPRTDHVPQMATPDFVPDKTPTSFTYALPAPGLGAIVGYHKASDLRPERSYEVNQATALGFSQPTASVGASIGYRF